MVSGNSWVDIESKLKRIEEDPEGAGTMHLYNMIQRVSSHANRAFEPLFERQVGKMTIVIPNRCLSEWAILICILMYTISGSNRKDQVCSRYASEVSHTFQLAQYNSC